VPRTTIPTATGGGRSDGPPPSGPGSSGCPCGSPTRAARSGSGAGSRSGWRTCCCSTPATTGGTASSRRPTGTRRAWPTPAGRWSPTSSAAGWSTRWPRRRRRGGCSATRSCSPPLAIEVPAPLAGASGDLGLTIAGKVVNPDSWDGYPGGARSGPGGGGVGRPHRRAHR
jgi:hypothetical protein